ncbi:MAG: hypothetical protein ACK5UQ_24140 [Planctomycetota bacterium]|jgi:hypothetical protein
MSGERVLVALGPVVDLFDRLAIPYHIGGSVATSVFGHARSTLDVDMVAAVEARHVGPIASALRGTYYADAELMLDAIQHRARFNLIYLPQYFKVDVFAVKDSPYARVAFARHTLAKLAGTSCDREFRFATPEDVVLHKLDWYRQGGETSERQWSDILSVLRIQVGRLDLDYMRKWAPSLDVADLLERVVRDAAS